MLRRLGPPILNLETLLLFKAAFQPPSLSGLKYFLLMSAQQACLARGEARREPVLIPLSCQNKTKSPWPGRLVELTSRGNIYPMEGSIRELQRFQIWSQELKPPIKYRHGPKHTMNITLLVRHPNGHVFL